MSKLDELIQEYCPDGVEYKPIKDLYKRIKGTPITAAQMKSIADDDGDIRIFAGGKTVVNAFEKDIPKANITRVPAVLVQSRGVIDFIYYDQPFTFKNEMWAYTLKDVSDMSLKYLYYILSNNVEYFRDAAKGMGSLPQISLPVTEEFEIPVPPLPVQEEIVRILDKLTELDNALKEELNLRIQQRNGIKQRLFSFDEATKWVEAGTVCDIEKGNTPIQKAESGVYPLVVTTMERKSCNKYQFDRPAVCIPLVSSRGHGVACLNHVYYQEGKFALGNILCAVMPKDLEQLDGKFLYQYLEYEKDYVLVPLMKGGANVAMHKDDIKNIKIPLLNINVQRDIVRKLQTCDDLISALRQEIEIRVDYTRYYRDKLLSFKRLEVA